MNATRPSTTSSALRQSARSDDWLIATVVTVCVHAVMGGLMYMAGEFIERPPPPEKPIEVEFVKPKPRVEKPKPPPPPEEKPEEKPPEPVEPEKEPPRKIERKVRRQPVERKIETPPPPTTEPPAPGPNTNDDAPAPVISLPDLGVGGKGPPVAVGRPKSRHVGTGGTGTNTGGGGTDPQATAAPPRPVSIAAIKKRARPLNPDLDTSKLYPEEAKQMGIEGQVKVFLVVDQTGKVVRRRITKSLGHGLDQVALKLALKLRFEPAVDTEGRAVTDKLEWTFTFVLPR